MTNADLSSIDPAEIERKVADAESGGFPIVTLTRFEARWLLDRVRELEKEIDNYEAAILEAEDRADA